MRKTSTTERELATHTAEIKHLQSDMDKLVADMEQVKKALLEIQKTLAEARGGWRMTMLIGGAGATIGGFIVHWFKG